jgi:hypothetical protein
MTAFDESSVPSASFTTRYGSSRRTSTISCGETISAPKRFA